MFCGKCGKENADEVRFCVHCGADLARQTPPESDVEQDGYGPTLVICGRCREPNVYGVTFCIHCGLKMAGAEETDEGATRTAETDAGTLLAGRYRITELLGSGGMGQVWKATDTELDAVVAIKALPLQVSRNKRGVDALKREAAIALKLTHENICRLHHFHTDGETKFLVMEYIPGQTLEELLDSKPGRKLSLDELLPIAKQAAPALDYAHAQKPPVLHRDIKPSNIMVTPDGGVKVLDFGIARELKDSFTRVTGRETSGTLLYMSPEQFSGKPPSTASDIYSFAATLYECLAGNPPFYQGSISHQLLNARPTDIAGVSGAANAALQAGLAKKPSDRPSTATELVEHTRKKRGPRRTVAAAETEMKTEARKARLQPVPPSTPTPDEQQPRPVRKRVLVAGVIAAICVAVALTIVLLSLRSGRAARGELHLARQGSKWGYIDETGRWAVKPRFRDAKPFSEGFAAVEKAPEEWGYINRRGRWVIKAQFYRASSFSEGSAAVTTAIVENRRRRAVEGYINTRGEWLVEPWLDDASDFSEGRALVKVAGKYGYMDTSGNWAIEPQFEAAESFCDGFARVRVNDKWGFIDKSGRWAIEARFDDATDFSGGRARVQVDKVWGYIDKTGNEVIRPQFASAKPFCEGLAAVRIETGERSWGMGFIDTHGRWVVQPRSAWIDSFSEGLACASVGRKSGFINKQGEWVVEPRFDSASSFAEGLARVSVAGKYGFIDKRGEWVIRTRFDDAEDFSGGLARVELNKKMGYINKTGKMIWQEK